MDAQLDVEADGGDAPHQHRQVQQRQHAGGIEDAVDQLLAVAAQADIERLLERTRIGIVQTIDLPVCHHHGRPSATPIEPAQRPPGPPCDGTRTTDAVAAEYTGALRS